MKAEFDAFADRYDEALQMGLSVVGEDKEYFARGRLRHFRRVLTAMGVPSDGSILDFGCGTGGSTPYFFSELGSRSVLGVDVSTELLEVARTTYGHDPRVSFHRIDEAPPRGAHDLAFVNGVFHHIPLAERADAIRYVFESIRPGGIFAFWENNPWNPGTRYIMSRIPFDRDARTITPPEARRLLGAGGLHIQDTEYRFVFPRALAWLRPLEDALASVPIGGQYLVVAIKPPAVLE